MVPEEVSYEQFRAWHDEAYLYVNQGMTQEGPDIQRFDMALLMYQRGLGIIDQALCVDTSGEGGCWAKARDMQAKMLKTRQHVDSRVKELADKLTENHENITAKKPYHENKNKLTNGPKAEPIVISDDDEDTGGCVQRSSSSDSLSEQADLILEIPSVQMYRISVSGQVSTPSKPSILRIVRFCKESRCGALGFLEVGSWSYPLVAGRSPVLKSESSSYMFPDLDGVQGDAVGIIIPDTASPSQKEALDSILASLEGEVRDYGEYKEFSANLASGLVKGAEVVGRGMVRGAVKTSELMFHTADMAKQYIQPEGAAREVDPRVREGLAAASWVTYSACRVSGWMVSKVGSATVALGRLAAPHLEKQATKALSHYTGQSSSDSSNQLAIAGEIASGTVAAVSTLYLALENSSKILAKNIANNTVMIVGHKYGTDMAQATADALSTAGNSYLTFYNAAALGPKGIAKRAAKDTGKAFIGLDQEAVAERARVAPDREGPSQGELVRVQREK